MTIATRFSVWSTPQMLLADHPHCSPALRSLSRSLKARWNLDNLGCYGVRSQRTSPRLSAHSWGAAVDMGYVTLGRARAVAEVIPYLIAWSDEWGIQAIHDYVGQRIWRAGRTPDESQACDQWWRAQKRDAGGMGHAWATWFHVEVHPARWNDPRDEGARSVS